MSPLKNEKIAQLSKQNSTNSMNQMIETATPELDNFEKKIMELSQENNSQESYEKEEFRAELSKNETENIFFKFKEEKNYKTDVKKIEKSLRPTSSRPMN